jgi:hypothetical protein
MLEFNVEPSGIWENGWMFYDESDGTRIPMNFMLAVAMREGVPGAELEYENWMKMATRVSKSLKVVKECDEEGEEGESQDHNREDEYEARWRSHQQQMDQRERPWAPSPIRSSSRHNSFHQSSPIQQHQNNQHWNQANAPPNAPPPPTPRTPKFGSINGERSGNPAQMGYSVKKCREEEYLMGYTGVPSLTQEDLERLGFLDPVETFDTIGPAHYSLMNTYEGNKYDGYTRGPKHDKLMQASLFEKLEQTDARSVLQWYKKTAASLVHYNIALMPFDDVELRYKAVGLCFPGVGRVRYNEMGRHLALFVETKLPMDEDAPNTHLAQALSLVASKTHPNGYEILQALLEETIPNYRLDDMEMQWPTYENYDSPYVYAQVMLQQVNMARKRGQVISQRVVVKTFLRNIVDYAKKDCHGWVAVMMKDQLENLDDDQVLPQKFELRQLAQKIMAAKTQPSDVKEVGRNGGIERRVYTTEMKHAVGDAGVPQEPEIRLMSQMESLKMNDHIQGYEITRFLINEVFRPNNKSFAKPFRRPMPNPSQAKKYNRPRRPYDPNAYCDACGRWGHKATRCDMLAMAIWLMEFVNRGGNEEVMKEIEKYWMERNAKEQQFKPTDSKPRTPTQVMETYKDKYCFNEEQIANELDWCHFQGDYAEEPEPEMPFEELFFAKAEPRQAE